MIVLDPLLPWPLLASLVFATALILGPSLLSRRPGAVLRAGAGLALAVLLAGPTWERRVAAEGADVVLVLRDKTPSSVLPGRAKVLETAEAAVLRRLAVIPGLDIWSLPPATDPAAALADAAAAVPKGRLSAAILLSDGQLAPPADGTLPAGVPIHLLLPGHAGGFDRRVRIVSPPAYAIVGRPLEIEAVVEDLGAPAGGPAVEVRITGAAGGLDRLQVRPGEPFRIPLTPDRAGTLVIGIEAPTLPGEAGTANNRAAVEIPALRDRLRVLLLSGEAHPGTRAWRRILRGDPAIDLVHLTILRTIEQYDATPHEELSLIPFPVRELFEESLPTFDLVVLDRFRNLPGLLPPAYIERLARRVQEEGGALLAVLGPEAAGEHTIAIGTLASVLPLTPGPSVETLFVPRVAAPAHPVLRGLGGANTWGPWGRRVSGTPAPGARTLLTAPDGTALLTLADVGKGRAAVLASDHIWWWGRGYEGGGPELELSRRLVHWLLREPDLEEQDLRLVREGGTWRAVRRDATGTPMGAVEAEGPDGRILSLPLVPAGPGIAEAVLPDPTPGLWRLRHGEIARDVLVADPDPREMADLRADPSLSAAWRQGGGHAWTGDGLALPSFRRTAPDAAQAGPGWMGLPRTSLREEARIRSSLPPLLPAALAGVLILLAWHREAH